MEKKSWVCTVIVQLALCFALYCAINMGQPQTPTYHIGVQRIPNEIYFISVRGGFRPLEEQTRLLKQIEKAVSAYKVGFVINISELGVDDPLLQNATRYFRSLKAAWYTTIARRADKPDCFFNQVNISNGKTLDIIALDTGSLQESSSGNRNGWLKQLSKKLESSNNNWHIGVGFHQLFCNQSLEQRQTKENDVRHILLKHGVDAYLSGQSCANEARMGGPYFTIISHGSYLSKEMAYMFLLHRVTPLEIATYHVSFEGNVIHESTIKQRGRDVM